MKPDTKYRKYSTVNVSKDDKKLLDDHGPAKINRQHWLGCAIREKMNRDVTHEAPTLERNQPGQNEKQIQ